MDKMRRADRGGYFYQFSISASSTYKLFILIFPNYISQTASIAPFEDLYQVNLLWRSGFEKETFVMNDDYVNADNLNGNNNYMIGCIIVDYSYQHFGKILIGRFLCLL